MRAYFSIPVLLSVVLTATACDSSPTGVLDSSITGRLVVAPSAATIRGGGNLQLILSAHDANGQATPPTDVTWTSSNPSVATVNSDGIVTGHTTGASVIAAWWNGAHSLATVTVIGDEPGTPQCPFNPAVPEFLRTSCTAQ